MYLPIPIILPPRACPPPIILDPLRFALPRVRALFGLSMAALHLELISSEPGCLRSVSPQTGGTSFSDNHNCTKASIHRERLVLWLVAGLRDVGCFVAPILTCGQGDGETGMSVRVLMVVHINTWFNKLHLVTRARTKDQLYNSITDRSGI